MNAMTSKFKIHKQDRRFKTTKTRTRDRSNSSNSSSTLSVSQGTQSPTIPQPVQIPVVPPQLAAATNGAPEVVPELNVYMQRQVLQLVTTPHNQTPPYRQQYQFTQEQRSLFSQTQNSQSSSSEVGERTFAGWMTDCQVASTTQSFGSMQLHQQQVQQQRQRTETYPPSSNHRSNRQQNIKYSEGSHEVDSEMLQRLTSRFMSFGQQQSQSP
jgi:hypothetical protein